MASEVDLAEIRPAPVLANNSSLAAPVLANAAILAAPTFASEVDLAEIKMSENSMWAFNIVGCGLVSHINTLAEKMRYFGPARYNIATIMKIISPPVLKAKISFNGEIHAKDYCFLLACNTRFTGKGMKMAPLAKLNDGLIDFLIVEKTTRLKLLLLFPKIFSGKHWKD